MEILLYVLAGSAQQLKFDPNFVGSLPRKSATALQLSVPHSRPGAQSESELQPPSPTNINVNKINKFFSKR